MATLDLGKVKVTYNGNWDSDKDYEPLCIVNSDWNVKYISIKDVKGDDDIKLTDTDYWQILSGDWVQQYQGSHDDDPDKRVDDSDLQEGDLYWNSNAKVLKFYDGTGWKDYISLSKVFIDDDYNADIWQRVYVKTVDKEITVTLPDNPADIAEILVCDKSHNASNKNITVDRNGKKINGKDEDLIIDKDNAIIYLTFDNDNDNWILNY